MPRPTNTRRKLKDCCVLLATFSPVLSSFHGTRPVSFATVTARLEDVGVLGSELDVVAARAGMKLLAGRRRAGRSPEVKMKAVGIGLVALFIDNMV